MMKKTTMASPALLQVKDPKKVSNTVTDFVNDMVLLQLYYTGSFKYKLHI